MMRSSSAGKILLCTVGALISVTVDAASDHVVKVPVLWSEPVYLDEAPSHYRCEAPVARRFGDIRRNHPGLSLGAAIRESLEEAGSCATHQAGHRTLRGYRVAFRHAGRTWIKIVPDRPGRMLSVRVNVHAAR